MGVKTHMAAWSLEVNEKLINFEPLMFNEMNFLAKLIQSGAGYSTVITAGSALSSILMADAPW